MRAVVLANGQIVDVDRVRREIRAGDLIVCANGGTRNALKLEVRPHVVIGDLDSVLPERKEQLEREGTQFIVYLARKDETDAELALRYCVECGATDILFLGALGGRLDHALANILLLACPEFASTPIRMVDGDLTLKLCRSRCRIEGQAGDIVTLLPWGGDVVGISTQGLEYPLDGDTLHFGPARGVSNVMLGDDALVTVESGLLLVIHQAVDALGSTLARKGE